MNLTFSTRDTLSRGTCLLLKPEGCRIWMLKPETLCYMTADETKSTQQTTIKKYILLLQNCQYPNSKILYISVPSGMCNIAIAGFFCRIIQFSKILQQLFFSYSRTLQQKTFTILFKHDRDPEYHKLLQFYSNSQPADHNNLLAELQFSTSMPSNSKLTQKMPQIDLQLFRKAKSSFFVVEIIIKGEKTQ